MQIAHSLCVSDIELLIIENDLMRQDVVIYNYLKVSCVIYILFIVYLHTPFECVKVD